MNGKIYALLVGIDNYAKYPLSGCVNDITAVEEYLRDRIPKTRLQLVKLIDAEATRQKIIDGFTTHLCQAGSEDVALFYYAGHGSQGCAPEEHWHMEPDRLNETIICWDSRTGGAWDLADKELAYLIDKVGQRDPHMVLIVDCCHSGSGTRDIDAVVRRVDEIDKRDRPLNSFIFAQESADIASRGYQENSAGWQMPSKNHILLAACRSDELAKEYNGDCQARGAFSYFLLHNLQKANGNLTYRELFESTNALVRGKVNDQSPQLEARNSIRDADQHFLGGAIAQRDPYFTVSHDKQYGWIVNGGAVHGLQKPSKGGTILALFPFGTDVPQLRDPELASGTAKVTQVRQQLSFVEISGIENLAENQTFKAIPISLPLPRLQVSFEGEETGVELARQALKTAGSLYRPSLYISAVENSEEIDIVLVADKGQYIIRRPRDDRPLVAPLPLNSSHAGYTGDDALKVIRRLEHIARWTNTLELSSPAASGLRPSDVKMEFVLYDSQTASTASAMRLEYEEYNGELVPPTLKIRLTNSSQRTLYCAVLDLAENFSVNNPFFDSSTVKLEAGAEIEGRWIDLVVPDELWSQGITEYKDIFKLIVNTQEFDARILEQEALDLPTRSLGDTYQSLFNSKSNTRDAVASRRDRSYDDWLTKEVAITSVRPQAVQSVRSDSSIGLSQIVELQPHRHLKAKACLSTVPQATRDLGNHILPPILRENPHLVQPFKFTVTRGADPGLSCLELTEVEDPTVVTPEAPLKLLVDRQIQENESILPVGYDGEFYLPLGRSVSTKDGKIEIRLDRLPEPISQQTRSVQGAVRIFFQKVISQKLGTSFEYPILAVASVDPQGKVSYQKDIESVKQKVAGAQKIILYIHGLTGDTQSIVPSVQTATVEIDGEKRSLGEFYDLVLTYDHESVNTRIEETARKLKQRLEAVGLGANHGKQLDIIAHSMGGLIARWFIEREGGNQVVQHLVLVGVPNAGSPWATLQDWAFTAITLGLNNLSAMGWQASGLTKLLDCIEQIDISFDQMRPDSDFIQQMANNPDPQVPYTIIAGNRSLAKAAMEAGEESSRLQRLMQKLFGKTVDAVVEPAFWYQANDLIATVASIKDVRDDRDPPPKKLPDTPCDHLTYFTGEAGLHDLAIALFPPDSSPVIRPTPEQPQTPAQSDEKQEKPFWTKPWFIAIVILLIAGVTAYLVAGQRSQENERNTSMKGDQEFAIDERRTA
ncbi:MAG: caspase family protein [Hormoscilla sp. SP5CHS1]|nr:caspase family protein [Hormoscilla sp. SP5CHS1]